MTTQQHRELWKHVVAVAAGREPVLQQRGWFIEAGMIHSARTVGDELVTVVIPWIDPSRTAVDELRLN